MNTRTSLIAIGATLALVAPAAASARAIVNQQSDTYTFTAHKSSHAFANTNFVSENGHKAAGRKTQVHKIVETNALGNSLVLMPAIAPSTDVDPNDCGDYGGTETCAA